MVSTHDSNDQGNESLAEVPASPKSKEEWERQFELEARAFAELLLDIYEYRQAMKGNSADANGPA